MHFLRNHKGLILLALLLIPAFYGDKTLITWVKEHRAFQDEAWYQPIEYLVKFITHGTTLIVLSLLVSLGARTWDVKLSKAAKSLFIGLITAGVVVQGFKHIIGRARPRMTFDTVITGPGLSYNYDSFPSGHTTLVFCLAFILSRSYPRYRVLFYLYAALAAADRVAGLSHFPSDIVGGAILGTVVAQRVLRWEAGRRAGSAGLSP